MSDNHHHHSPSPPDGPPPSKRPRRRQSFKEVPVTPTASRFALDELRLSTTSMASALRRQRDNGGTVLRIEYAYDAKVAITNGKGDNVARRFAVVDNMHGFVHRVKWPLSGASIHEVIPGDMKVKPWFDLDGFDLSVHYIDMISFFEMVFIDFMLDCYDITIDETRFAWTESCSKTKNSLHVTILHHTVSNNVKAMRALVKSFTTFLDGYHTVGRSEWIKHALQADGVIDTQVYKNNSSIRVVGCSKLTDPSRYLNIVPGHHTNDHMDSFVTCGFKPDCVSLDQGAPEDDDDDDRDVNVFALDNDGAYDDDLFRIILADCLDDDDLVVKRMVPGRKPWSKLCVVRDHRTCYQYSGGDHSDDDDVYFIVDLFSPAVIQKCHSIHCKGKPGHELYHKSGYFGPLSSDIHSTVNRVAVRTYVNKVSAAADLIIDPELKLLEQVREHKKITAVYKEHLFGHYYNKFFSAITYKAPFMIGVVYEDMHSGCIKKNLFKRSDFLFQHESLPYIKEWVEWPLRTEKQHVDYLPLDTTMRSTIHLGGHPNEDCPVITPTAPSAVPGSATFNEHNFNLFCGLAITHEQALAYDLDRKEVKPFLDHIRRVWCSNDVVVYKWIISWMAHVYMRPWDTLKSCIVLQGEKGAGKGIIVDTILSQLFGDDNYWHVTSMNGLTGTYTNPKFMTTLLGFVDEAFWGGDPKQANSLKCIITEERLDMNVKYQAQTVVRKYMNTIIASNNDTVVELTKDNRRFQFVTLKPKKFDTPEHKRAYFDRLMSVKPIAIAAYFAKCVCLCNFNPGLMFKTSGSTAQLVSSMDAMQQWWYHVLCTASGVLDYFEDGVFPLCSVMREDMIAFSKQNGNRYANVATASHFSRKLRELCPSILPGTRTIPISPTQRAKAYVLPSISDARECFNKYFGREFNYDI